MDNRVALTPAQCRWIQQEFPAVKILVQPSETRCFPDSDYMAAGIEMQDDLSSCNILLGIKEVPVEQLIAGKTYLFFSHTKKMQPYNRGLLQTIIQKKITLIDYECLEHEDGQRIIGFGFFAGVVGAHNGMMAYGKRTGQFELGRVYEHKNIGALIPSYFGLKLPPLKVVVTGSGRVASGILEVMNPMGIKEVEPEDFLSRNFSYPVFTQLKGADLYAHQITGDYNRDHFHAYPAEYNSIFSPYTKQAHVLINGIYWDNNAPRLFEWEDIRDPLFTMFTIADITDDKGGSVPCNLGDATIANPVYGVDIKTGHMIDPYQPSGIDVMAVGNLPNELAVDASQYFGEQLIKYVLEDLLKGSSAIIERASIAENGKLTERYQYMAEYIATDL